MTPMAMRCLICVAVCVLAAAAIAPSPSAAQSAEDISALNQQVVELYQVGSYAEAIPVAQRASEQRQSQLFYDGTGLGALFLCRDPGFGGFICAG